MVQCAVFPVTAGVKRRSVPSQCAAVKNLIVQVKHQVVAEQSITKRLDLAPGNTAAHLAKSECGEKARQKEGRGAKVGQKAGWGQLMAVNV